MGKAFGSPWMAPVLAVVLGLLALGASLADVPLAIARHQTGPGGPVAYTLVTLAVAVPGAAVGVLLAARRPRNPIGWLLLVLLLLAANPASDYAILDYRLHHGTLPLGWAAAVFLASSPAVPVLLAILLWVFPDGRLPQGRWQPGARALIAAGALLVVVTTVAPGVTAVAGHHVRIDADGNLDPVSPAWTIAGNVAVVAAIASMLAWLAVQVPRYRRADYERRQQLKWLYSGAVVFVASLFLAVMTNDSGSAWSLAVNDVISPLGFAVLKYRLYAIDRIISRVISYAVISAVLAGLFAGLVLLATQVVQVHTPVGVAVATLAAAALFNPLRRRVQRSVDRRFNRSRYNAEAVIAEFTRKLRGTVDLDAVRDDLAAAVDQAFEPVHVSVWLPGPGPAR